MTMCDAVTDAAALVSSPPTAGAFLFVALPTTIENDVVRGFDG